MLVSKNNPKNNNMFLSLFAGKIITLNMTKIELIQDENMDNKIKDIIIVK